MIDEATGQCSRGSLEWRFMSASLSAPLLATKCGNIDFGSFDLATFIA